VAKKKRKKKALTTQAHLFIEGIWYESPVYEVNTPQQLNEALTACDEWTKRIQKNPKPKGID
jgi:hypothetical protein